MASEAPKDIDMADTTSTQPQETIPETAQVNEPKFGGFTRFEVELEFVQCLANPHYLMHLATLTAASSPDPSVTASKPGEGHAHVPLLSHPPFIAYLKYLQYFTKPPYLKYLTYPGPTLKNLELLQNERFRREILSPDVVAALVEEGKAAVAGGAS